MLDVWCVIGFLQVYVEVYQVYYDLCMVLWLYCVVYYVEVGIWFVIFGNEGWDDGLEWVFVWCVVVGMVFLQYEYFVVVLQDEV